MEFNLWKLGSDTCASASVEFKTKGLLHAAAKVTQIPKVYAMANAKFLSGPLARSLRLIGGPICIQWNLANAGDVR